jgi:4-amino-4-deoxy-L-arabinose transferase-like glycosyltransferase
LKLWAARGFLGGVVAIALALYGQHALQADPNARAVAWGYGLAIAVLLVSLFRPKLRSDLTASDRQEGSPAAGRRIFWAGFLLSLILVGAADVLVWKGPTSRQALAAILWGLGLLLLVLVFRKRGAWTGSHGLLPGPRDDGFAPGLPQPGPRLEAALAAGMLLLAAALRIARLSDHPGLFGDEGEMGMDARAILEGHPAPFFGYGWGEITNVLYYASAAMLRLFGDDVAGLRMLATLGGIAGVFLVYRIGRLLWGPRAGLLAGTFLAVQPLALQFSRFATNSGLTGTLWAAGFFFLYRTLRFGALRDACLSGIAFGSSLYFYPSGKLVFILLPAVAGYLLLIRARFARDLLPRLAVLFLAFVLTFSPHAVTSFRDGWESFTARYQARAIFTPPNRPEAFARAGLVYDPAWRNESLPQSFTRHPREWGRVLYTQLRDSLRVLSMNGDPTVFYNIRVHRSSMLSPWMAALALLGLVWVTANLLDPRYELLLLWFWGGLLGPALTLDTPSVQRLTGAWPAAMLLPAVLLDRIAAASWPLHVSFARRWVNAALAALLGIVTLESIREYFVHYPSMAPYGDSTTQARYARSLGTTFKAYQLGVGDAVQIGDVYFNYGSTRFLAKGVEGADVVALSDILPVTDEVKKGVAFIVRDSNADYLPILRAVYPGGQEEVLHSPDGIRRFTAYKLSPAQVGGFHTLRTTYTQADGRTVERDEPGLGTPAPGATAVWRPPRGLAFPSTVLWEGGLVAPAYGRYRYTLAADAGARLAIDGIEIASGPQTGPSPATLELVLARGLHEVRLSGVLKSPETPIVVTSAFEAEAAQPIARRLLLRRVLGGLTGEVWTNSTARLPSVPETSPSVRRVDPAIGFREARDDHSFGQGPFVVRWRGRIRTESPGEYLFEARSNGASTLSIDGRPVLSTRANAASVGTVRLAAGSHPLELLYEWDQGRARIDLFWTPPSGAREIVPPTAWSPERRSWRAEKPRSP